MNIKKKIKKKKKEIKLNKFNKKTNKFFNYRDDEIIKLKKKIINFDKKIFDNMLRYKAEIDNLRKRNIKEIEKANKFGIEKLVYELLNVIDNLERTLEIINKKKFNKNIIKGINLTKISLLNILKKFGLEIIDKINILFDPLIHQAIKVIKSPNHKSNEVIDIMQKGYILNKRLIRPAMVIVCK